MSGFDNDCVYANNIDLSGAGNGQGGNPTLLTDGQMLIASTALNAGNTHVNVGKIIAGSTGTVVVGYISPNITLDVVGGGTSVVEHLTGTTGGQLNPTGNNFNILGGSVAAGTTPVAVAGVTSTLTVNVQKSQAIASTDATKVGLAAFSSGDFAVDANGFVTIVSGGFTWTDATNATYTLAAQNGYITDRGGGVTYTLPASGALGDEIRIVGKLGLTTIAQNANQQIVFASSSSTVGVTGSITGTNVGDCMTLVCITSGASTVWRIADAVGNLTVA